MTSMRPCYARRWQSATNANGWRTGVRLMRCARYSGLRRYLPAFFALPFRGEPGNEAVLSALDVVRQLDAGTRTTVPAQAPTAFVPSKFRAALHHLDGTVDRRTWELGLAVAVRDGLRSGDVFLPASRRHVSFANLLYDPTRW